MKTTIREKILQLQRQLAELEQIPEKDWDKEVRFPDGKPVIMEEGTKIYCNWDCGAMRPCTRGCTHYKGRPGEEDRPLGYNTV